MGERIDSETAQELLDRAELVGAPEVYGEVSVDTDGGGIFASRTLIVFCEDFEPDDYLCEDVFSCEAQDGCAPARARLLAAAPDLAHTVIAQAADIATLTAERDEARKYGFTPYQYGRMEGIAIGLRSGGDPKRAAEMMLEILNKPVEVSDE